MENVLLSMLVWFLGLKTFFKKLSCCEIDLFLLVCGSMILKACTDSCNHNYNQDTEQFYHPLQFPHAILLLLLLLLSSLPP